MVSVSTLHSCLLSNLNSAVSVDTSAGGTVSGAVAGTWLGLGSTGRDENEVENGNIEFVLPAEEPKQCRGATSWEAQAGEWCATRATNREGLWGPLRADGDRRVGWEHAVAASGDL